MITIDGALILLNLLLIVVILLLLFLTLHVVTDHSAADETRARADRRSHAWPSECRTDQATSGGAADGANAGTLLSGSHGATRAARGDRCGQTENRHAD